jgi:hypothetical protein
MHSKRDFPWFSRGPLRAEPFDMRRRFAAVSAVLVVSVTSFARADGDAPATTSETVDASPQSKVGSDRLSLSMGTPAIGGLWREGDSSGKSPGLAGAIEYGHVFTPWLELGVGFGAEHRIGSSLGAYRPYGFVRVFATTGDAEIGFAFRAGPTWFHFDVDDRGYTLTSVAPSAAVDARIWISPRVALVGAIEALASGALVESPGAPSGVDRSQVWNVATIASLGVSFRL